MVLQTVLNFFKRVYRAKDDSIMMFSNPSEVCINGKRKWIKKPNGNYSQKKELQNGSFAWNEKFESDNIKWMAKCKLIIK